MASLEAEELTALRGMGWEAQGFRGGACSHKPITFSRVPSMDASISFFDQYCLLHLPSSSWHCPRALCREVLQTMASVQANHPLYDTFSDVGFRGRFQILEMNETTYHVRIWEDGEDGDMEVLWTTTAEVDPWSGSFQVMEKNFRDRTCRVRLTPEGSNASVLSTWLLDREPTSLHDP